MAGENCSDFFDCEDNISLEAALRNMIVKDDNGCPVLKTKVVSQTPSYPVGSTIQTAFITGADAATLETNVNNALSMMAAKIFSIIPVTAPSGETGVLINYFV